MDNEIKTTRDLCAYFGVLRPRCEGWFARLDRAVYKDTACGASLTIKVEGKWHTEVEAHGRIEAVRFHSIVEGFEVEVDSPVLPCPANKHALSALLRDLDQAVYETLRELEAAEPPEDLEE